MDKRLRKLFTTVEKDLLHRPSRKTLNRLALLAGFQSWDALANAFEGRDDDSDGADETADAPHPKTDNPQDGIHA